MRVISKLFFVAFLFIMTTAFSQQTYSPELIRKVEPEIKKYIENKKDNKVYNTKTLNYYFSNILNNYIVSPETPSNKEFTAILKTDDKTFDFGYTKDFRKGDLTKYMRLLGYMGFKAIGTTENSFFSLTDTKENPINFGLDLRFTIVLGFRSFKPRKGSGEKVPDFRGDTIKQQAEINEEKFDITKSELGKKVLKTLDDEDVEDLSKEKINNTIAKEMNDFIKKEKLDKWSYLVWLNFGFFQPLNNVDYTYITDQNVYVQENELEEDFNNKKYFGSANIYAKVLDINESLGIKGTLTNTLSYFRNNNILTGVVKKKTFTNLVENSENQFLPIETKEIFTGDYREFWTTQIKTEIVTILYKDVIGVSGAMEWNFGSDYDKTNWKLGIPFNIKDKDGKNTINFELQWREINANHFVGIRIGKAFGAFVN
ncbi:hypothetical protein [Flagellimonas myxillae]|uniref:hypothetical protein n=1 Tax=Flagellimonas myxillae TaxID=2942214 RepID=UPI00201EFACA|nr:hypothetical protein [Muricauda myxillae]MCL6264921.1 hypothetical protein [Muricauda myxillae]